MKILITVVVGRIDLVLNFPVLSTRVHVDEIEVDLPRSVREAMRVSRTSKPFQQAIIKEADSFIASCVMNHGDGWKVLSISHSFL